MRIGLRVLAFVLVVAPAARAADAGVVICPPSIPVDGGACSGSGLCEYGGEAHGLCSTFVTCELGAWKVAPPSPSCGTNGFDCPSAFDAIPTGVVCPLADHQAACVYDEGICACPSMCLGPNGVLESQWLCHAWSEVQTGCPETRPPLGSACSQEGQACLWDGCCGGMPLGPDEKCTSGAWTFYPIDECACGGGAQACKFAPVTLDAGFDADASVGAEPEERVTGCACGVASRTSSRTGWSAIVVALLAYVSGRTRRRSCSASRTSGRCR